MVERIREILNRFPENEEAVRELIRANPDFDALCQEYKDITQELRRLEGRRGAVEEELLTRIEGYEPV